MYLKILTLAFLQTVLSTDCCGQLWFGIDAGVTLNQIKAHPNINSTSYPVAFGYSFGGKAQYHFNRKIGIEFDLMYLTKNYSINRTDSLAGEYQHFRNAYLQIPLQLSVSLLQKNKFELNISAGGFLSYWISSRVKGQVPNILNTTTSVNTQGQLIENIQWTSYNTSYQFDNKRDNRYELGLLFGTEIIYTINPREKFFVHVSYMNSLTDLQKHYSISNTAKINKTTLISLGILVMMK